jgi:hypothetical protein
MPKHEMDHQYRIGLYDAKNTDFNGISNELFDYYYGVAIDPITGQRYGENPLYTRKEKYQDVERKNFNTPKNTRSVDYGNFVPAGINAIAQAYDSF